MYVEFDDPATTYFVSVMPSVSAVCDKQNPSAGQGPPGLDSQAASFTALWIADWHFGKVTPQLILSNPFHGHRLSQPAIHPSNQPDDAASPISPCLTLFRYSHPHDDSLCSLFDLAHPCFSPTLLHAALACNIWAWSHVPGLRLFICLTYLAKSACWSVVWSAQLSGP